MHMRWVSWITIVIFIVPITTLAEDKVIFSPQVGIQLKRLKFEQDFSGGSSSLQDNSGSLTADLPTLRLSFVTAYRKYSLQFKYESNISTPSTSSTVPLTKNETDVDRTDWSINVGYSFSQNIRFLAGYLSGKTELTPEPNDCYDTNIVGCIENLAYLSQERGIKYTQEYTEDGFFFGAGYAKNYEHNRFSFSLAYAFLDSTYQDNNSSSNDFKFSGDSDGYAFSATWSRPLWQSIDLYVNGRYQNFVSDGNAQDGIWAGSKHKTTEQILLLDIGILYIF